MQTLMVLKKERTKKTSVSPQEKSFKRLRKQIENLEKEFQQCTADMDGLLSFHSHHLGLAKQRLASKAQKELHILYSFYKKKKIFLKREKEKIKDFILDALDLLSRLIPIEDAMEETVVIYDDFYGAEEAPEEVLKDFLGEAQEALDDIEGEDLFSELFGEFFKERIPPKTKKQEEMECQQKDVLKTVYKGLAKTLHPDLEQDPILKKEKESLMVQVTTAYAAEDINTLLALEKQYKERQKENSEEELFKYNQALKVQVKALKKMIAQIQHSPKYFHLTPFLEKGVKLAEKSILQSVSIFKEEEDLCENRIKHLVGEKAVPFIKNFILRN